MGENATFLSFVLFHPVTCKNLFMMCSVSDKPEQITYIMCLRCMMPPSQSCFFRHHEHELYVYFLWSTLRVHILIALIPSGSWAGRSGRPACVPCRILRPLPFSPAPDWGRPSVFFDSVPRFCATLPVCRQSVIVFTATAAEEVRTANSLVLGTMPANTDSSLFLLWLSMGIINAKNHSRWQHLVD